MLRSTKSATKLGIFSLVLCVNFTNAVEVEVKGKKNWVWFGTNTPPANHNPQKEQNGKVTLEGSKYYVPPSNFINSITLTGNGGGKNNGLASLATNQQFTIGTLTMKGESTLLNVVGVWGERFSNMDDCGWFNVENLVLETTSGKTQYVKFINAKKTTITGDGVINIGNKTDNISSDANLGEVIVKGSGKGVTIRNVEGTKTTANSITIESGKVTFGAINGNLNVDILDIKSGEVAFNDQISGNVNIDTIDIKNGATISKSNSKNKVTISSVVAEAGVVGLDKILNDKTTLTITAIKSSSIAEFLSETPTTTNIGNQSKYGANIKHNVADSGLFKYSGDFVQTLSNKTTATARKATAKNNATYAVTTSTKNLNVAPSDRFQATLDNAYLAHHILLSNAMAVNNKLFMFDSLKNDEESIANQVKNAQNSDAKNPNAQNDANTKNDDAKNDAESQAENYIDSWVGYEYNGVKKYGKTLNIDTHSVQLGVGYLQTNRIKVGGFFRYTYLGAENIGIGNKYSAHAYNAGLYGVANMWSGGYFRGQFSYTGINAKGDYTLRNDMTGVKTSGVMKDNSHYLTANIGIAQEGIMGDIFWGSIAVDLTHIMPLMEDSDFDDYRFSKNSITLATLSGMLGVKVFDAMVYATGQVGYAMSPKDREIDLRNRAKSDFYAGGKVTQNSQWKGNFGVVNDYKYNMIVGDIGVGAAYNFTKAFKGALYLGAGFYSESKPNFRAGVNLNYLF